MVSELSRNKFNGKIEKRRATDLNFWDLNLAFCCKKVRKEGR